MVLRPISNVDLHRRLHLLNPHWSSTRDTTHLKERAYLKLLYPLFAHSTVKRATLLLGPRRVGKTVMIRQVIERLIQEGVPPSQIAYFSLDTPLLQGLPLEDLITLFREAVTQHRPQDLSYVFFDEIQYLSNWQTHLKTLVDQFDNIRILASGSAAAALRRSSIESGAGRFSDFILPPLSFYEYLDLLNIESEDSSSLNTHFIRYLNIGGYPEALFSSEIQRNPELFLRSDIIEKALLRDLPSLYGIQDIQELLRLFNTLAYQTAGEITLEALSKRSGIAKNTIKRYLEYLEAAFLIKVLRRIDQAGRTFKREHYSKIYLTNPSIYCALFGPATHQSTATPFLVETAFFSQILHSAYGMDRFFYARWNAAKGVSSEVDFVTLSPNLKPNGAIEIKWSDRPEANAIIKFCQKHQIQKALITTQTLEKRFSPVPGLEIACIPVTRLCLESGRLIFSGQGAHLDTLINSFF